jgi:hypothetical protein
MLSRYSLTHVIVTSQVETICSTGFFFKFSARKAQKKISDAIKNQSNDNLYFRSEKTRGDVTELLVHDVKHYLTIQKL